MLAPMSVEPMFTAEFWDERYGSAAQIWSGQPNPHLVSVAGELPPGAALDVGSGEGADAVWLATKGWQVTGIDISSVALDRAAAHAKTAGVAERVTWEVADVFTWVPEPHRFDLVSAQFMHLPRPVMRALHRRLAAALRPGGTLLVVLHHPDDDHAHGAAEMRPTAEELAAELAPGEWATIEASAPSRSTTAADGTPAVRRDAVLRAVRAG
jgi:SAM-dependent methyltransferase